MNGAEGVSHVVLQIYLFFANPFWLGEFLFLILIRLWAQGFGQDFEAEVQQDFETGACSAFCRWCFVEVMKLNLGRYSEARLGQDFEF